MLVQVSAKARQAGRRQRCRLHTREQVSVQTRLQARVQARWVQMQMGAEADGCRQMGEDAKVQGRSRARAPNAAPHMLHAAAFLHPPHLACSPPQTIVPTGRWLRFPDFSEDPGWKNG